MIVTVKPVQAKQHTQVIGGGDEHMVATVTFQVEAGGRLYPEVSVDLKQVVGSTYREAAFEASAPKGYDGPWNTTAFLAGIAKYYNGLMSMTTGGNPAVVKMHPDAKATLIDSTFAIPGAPFEFEATDGGRDAGGGGW